MLKEDIVREVDAKIRIKGKILAENITFEEFMEHDEWEFVEWVYGLAVQMSGIDKNHDAISRFLSHLFSAYVALLGGGIITGDPMIMRTKPSLPARAPDLQVLLPESISKLKQNRVMGAADLVVEIVSEGSEKTDRVHKLREYEEGGVPEYWIIDHRFKETLFYQMDENGDYQRIQPDENGVYHSKMLSRLTLRVDLLWQDPLPNIFHVGDMVQAMFVDGEAS